VFGLKEVASFPRFWGVDKDLQHRELAAAQSETDGSMDRYRSGLDVVVRISGQAHPVGQRVPKSPIVRHLVTAVTQHVSVCREYEEYECVGSKIRSVQREGMGMRSYLVALLLLISSNLSNLSAHATGIVDLQFVGEGHTITFSLPDSAIIWDTFPSLPTLGASAPTTIDGVSGYTVPGTYYTRYSLGQFPTIVLYTPGSTFGGSLLLWGPVVLNDTFIPIGNPDRNHPGDLLVTFVPGTYSLERSTSGWYYDPIAPYTLTITEENSAVPEPASLVLLVTGALGALGVMRSRWPVRG
jgi:hypothetical protein